MNAGWVRCCFCCVRNVTHAGYEGYSDWSCAIWNCGHEVNVFTFDWLKKVKRLLSESLWRSLDIMWRFWSYFCYAEIYYLFISGVDNEIMSETYGLVCLLLKFVRGLWTSVSLKDGIHGWNTIFLMGSISSDNTKWLVLFTFQLLI